MAGRRTFRVLTSSSRPASKVKKKTAIHTLYSGYFPGKVRSNVFKSINYCSFSDQAHFVYFIGTV